MKILPMLFAALGLAACAPLTPRLDSRFGDTVNLLKTQQTIDAQAGASAKQASQDGAAAREAMGRYYQSYRAPAPQPSVFSIGVGGGIK